MECSVNLENKDMINNLFDDVQARNVEKTSYMISQDFEEICGEFEAVNAPDLYSEIEPTRQNGVDQVH